MRKSAAGLLLFAIALVPATAHAQTTVSASPASVIVGGTLTATWAGIPAPSTSNWLGLFKPGDPSTNFYRYESASTGGAASGSVPIILAHEGTYELRLFSSGYTLLATSNSFTVVAPPSVSGTASLNGRPLSGVVFTATNGVTCSTSNGYGQYSCTVPVGWSGSVTPSRGGVSFTPASRDYSAVTVSQTAQDYPATSTTTLSVSPASVIVGSTVTATWSGTPGPSDANWLGLFNPGAPSTSFYLYGSQSANGMISGSLPFTLSAGVPPGTYELRLLTSSTTALLATSNTFTVSGVVSVSGTVTAGGSPLGGVVFSASNGGTCTTSNTAGQYSCTAPQGWSGSVTPSLGGYNFTPVTRSYNAVQANQTAQDFVGATVGASGIYYIVPDHLNTPRLIADQAGNTVWRNDNTEPFGDSIPNDNPSGLGAFDFPLRFPGQYFDKETNLAYNHFRDYDTGIGRYIESDPLGAVIKRPPMPVAALNNLYVYVASNPLSFEDPLGLLELPNWLQKWGEPFGGGTGAVLGGKCAQKLCKQNWGAPATGDDATQVCKDLLDENFIGNLAVRNRVFFICHDTCMNLTKNCKLLPTPVSFVQPMIVMQCQ